MKICPNSVWTQDRIDQLKALWAEDELSCSGIAARLGGGISRNAVIGKARRLGLVMKGKAPVQRRPKPRRAPRAAVVHTIRKNGAGYVAAEEIDIDPATVEELEAQALPATFLGITFIGLEPQHCRYPRTVEDVTLYCGQPKIEDSVYCRDCHRRCHSRANYALNNVRRAA